MLHIILSKYYYDIDIIKYNIYVYNFIIMIINVETSFINVLYFIT